MSEPSPSTDPTVPPATAPDPATSTPVAAPPQAAQGKPARGKKVGIWVGLAVAGVVALVVRLAVGNWLGGPNLDDYKVGACIDSLPVSAAASTTSIPDFVDCSGTSAKAEIVAVFPDRPLSVADLLCPPAALSAMELTNDGRKVLICLRGR